MPWPLRSITINTQLTSLAGLTRPFQLGYINVIFFFITDALF